jgi:hypothetical protein
MKSGDVFYGRSNSGTAQATDLSGQIAGATTCSSIVMSWSCKTVRKKTRAVRVRLS